MIISFLVLIFALTHTQREERRDDNNRYRVVKEFLHFPQEDNGPKFILETSWTDTGSSRRLACSRMSQFIPAAKVKM